MVTAVALIAKPGNGEASALAREIVQFLRARSITPLLEGPLAGELGLAAAEPARLREAGLCVVAGGDGTLIHAVRLLDGAEVPIFAVNAGGQLGFITEIPRAQALPLLERALAGTLAIEARQKLRATLTRKGKTLIDAEVLNDAVINRGATARMVDLRTSIDGETISSFRADGVIICTPTGSTAYNLAANGPILFPTMDVVLITPICPHTLSQRPLVVPDRCCTRVEVLAAHGELLLSLDGQVGENLELGDCVELRRAPHRVLLVKNPGLDFFEILRQKLHWGQR
ncbi:MAG: NAD(+)/NADH kinase [Deltaproteobacteria bacterium]